MNYSPPAEDWTEKQLQDKQFAKLKMHVNGSPCRCNTAYLADARCFIDAESPCFRRHQPDEIPAMLHFTTTRPSLWKPRALLSFLISPSPRLCCLPPNLQSHIWQNCVHAGKHKWRDEDEMWANAPHLPFRLGLWKLTLSACWEVLCWLQEELPIDPTSTFPIQWSCSLILQAMLIQGYNLHSTDKSGSILRRGLWDQCASTETCWLFSH